MANSGENQVWELTPFVGVGPLRFGMTREEIIANLGEPDMVVHREPLLMESHRGSPAMPIYDAENHLIAAQLVRPGQLTFQDLTLIARPVESVRHDLERRGFAVANDEEGQLVVSELGLHFYAPPVGDDPGIVSSVVAGSRDYETFSADYDAFG
jgi:hypothetical protein